MADLTYTYVRLAEAFIYLAVILDAFSRKVIGWAMTDGHLTRLGSYLEWA